MSVKLFFPLLIISVLNGLVVLGNKSYNVTIKLNKGISLSLLRIYVDDGKSQKHIEITDTLNLNISIKGDYYSRYAMIKFTYPKQGSLVSFFENRFFVNEKASVITFKKWSEGESPFVNYDLMNAFDLKKEKARMDKYVSNEQDKVNAYLLQHDKEVYTGSDTAIQNEYFRLYDKVENKYFNYVLENGSSYYAFVYYRRNLLNILPADSMLQIFKKTFPVVFKNSEEGKTITKYLKSKLSVKLNNIVPNFNSKDITGNKVSLYSFRNKKYVLLTFWATWCGPCIAEMPKIKEIHKKYSHDLEIISVAHSSNYQTYSKVVKENDMKWVNIYNDAELINNYGGQKGIPRIYLIDKTGRIIYDNNGDENKDIDLTKLESMLLNLELKDK